jgi:hypothetical protein
VDQDIHSGISSGKKVISIQADRVERTIDGTSFVSSLNFTNTFGMAQVTATFFIVEFLFITISIYTDSSQLSSKIFR